MKFGLGDRNNESAPTVSDVIPSCLNEVRSWRPEQLGALAEFERSLIRVSMKSGLGDRNNRWQRVQGCPSRTTSQ